MFGMKLWKVLLVVTICLVAFGISAFGASVPQIINYQGTLKNNGTPANGSVNMVFSVYSSATGGGALWTENWSTATTPPNPVIVINGNFNVMLGAISPFSSTFFSNHPKTYLGIKVGTDSEMLPRQTFASVGYSLAAENGIPKGGIIMWSGAVNQMPDGWVLCDGTNGTPDLRDRFVVGAGGGYSLGQTGGVSTHAHGYSGTTTNANTDQHDVANGSDHSKTSATHTHNYSGFTDSQSNLPPYYALAFIMKL